MMTNKWFIQGKLLIIRSKAKGKWNGLMKADVIREILKRIRCMDKDSLLGKMEASLQALL